MLWSHVKMPGQTLGYGTDIDVVKYLGSKRHTINPEAPIQIDLLQDFFNEQKCSMRVLKPQTFSSSLAKLMCLTDELFATDTGCNAYITPAPKADKPQQGFAPHFDDIDAFLLQMEG